MSGNVHPNRGPVFPSSVCAGNVTWRGRSVQCCTCYEWDQLRCSLLSSRFNTLGSSYFWSCASCCIPACFGGSTPTNTVTSFSVPQLLYLHCSICSIWPRFANVALLPHPCLQTHLISFLSITLTRQLFSIAPLAVAPVLLLGDASGLGL